MKISNKAIVGTVGLLMVGAVTVITKEPVCLWALILVNGTVAHTSNDEAGEDSIMIKGGKNDKPNNPKPEFDPPSQKAGK